MRALTTRGRELAGVIDPICDRPACGGVGGFGLDSGYRVTDVTVADRDDISPGDLLDACRRFLQGKGRHDIDDDVAEMAAETAEAAARFRVGTRLRPEYDYDRDKWLLHQAVAERPLAMACMSNSDPPMSG